MAPGWCRVAVARVDDGQLLADSPHRTAVVQPTAGRCPIILAVLIPLNVLVATSVLGLFAHSSVVDGVVIGTVQAASLALVISQIVFPDRWGIGLLAPSLVVSIRRGVLQDLSRLEAEVGGSAPTSRLRRWYDCKTRLRTT